MANAPSITTDPLTGLPTLPFRNRRALDAQWADALRQHGIRKFVGPQPPDPPLELRRAVEQFNRGEFWECHETLEDVWRETPYPFRLFYHAVIKTAVGFHHLSQHNRNGARTKLRDGVELLELFQPEWMAVRTDLLLTATAQWLSFLETPTPTSPKLHHRPKPHILTLRSPRPLR